MDGAAPSPPPRSLRELWDEHESEPFPPALVGARVEGHCLLTLEAHAAGCARAFFENRGFLGYYGAGVLLECHTDLSEVLEAMHRDAVRGRARGRPTPGPDPYFLRLHEITGRMLAHLSRRHAAKGPAQRWWHEPPERSRSSARPAARRAAQK